MRGRERYGWKEERNREKVEKRKHESGTCRNTLILVLVVQLPAPGTGALVGHVARLTELAAALGLIQHTHSHIWGLQASGSELQAIICLINAQGIAVEGFR